MSCELIENSQVSEAWKRARILLGSRTICCSIWCNQGSQRYILRSWQHPCGVPQAEEGHWRETLDKPEEQRKLLQYMLPVYRSWKCRFPLQEDQDLLQRSGDAPVADSFNEARDEHERSLRADYANVTGPSRDHATGLDKNWDKLLRLIIEDWGRPILGSLSSKSSWRFGQSAGGPQLHGFTLLSCPILDNAGNIPGAG